MEIMMKIIMVLVMLVGTIAIAGLINLVLNRKIIDPKIGKISFRESMDLVDLPIVTFRNNNEKLNFLLDTGASYSSINESALKDKEYAETGISGSYFGIEGKPQEARYIKMEVNYKEKNYAEEFQVVDLDDAFNSIKHEFGITLHGILGSSFFQKYKYILDFDELVAYSMV